jgi:hypothetical protein
MIDGDTEEDEVMFSSSDGEVNKILYVVYKLFSSHVLLNLWPGHGL